MSTEILIHPKYRPDIDGLRAVAILPIVVFHAFPDLIPGGFIGVDIFFVISGFLISTIIISNLEKNTFNFPEFFQRRIKRIFPALILVLGACFTFGWFALLPNEYQQLGKHMLGGASFTSNFILWGESGYFDNASATKPLLHLWSLGVEEQFYIIWPLTLWFAHKKKLNLLYVAIGVCLASFIFNIVMLYEDSTYTFYSPQTRLWELQVGAILAYLFHKRNEVLDAGYRKYCAFIGLGMLVAGLLNLSCANYFPGWWALLPTLGAVLIIFAGPSSWINRAILANKVMVWFGKISYPLYLWHWPLLSFAYIMESGTPSLKIKIGCILLSVVLAWATYKLVEVPIRSGAVINVTPKLAVLILLMGVLGGIGYAQNGFTTRSNILQYEQYTAQLSSWDKAYSNNFCKQYSSSFMGLCRKAKSSEPTVILLGDSHSNHLYPGMEEALRATQDNVMSLSISRCLPFINVDSDKSQKHKCTADLNLKFAVEHESIKTVIISAKWDSFISGTWWYDSIEDAKHQEILPEITTNLDQIFKADTQATIRHLLSMNKRIIFVLDTPDLGFNPQSCFSRPLTISNRENRAICAVSRKDFEERSHEYRKLVLSVLKDFPSVQIFDAATSFCDNDWCWAAKNERLFYQDENHLSVEGSRLVAKRLVKLL